MTEKTRRQKLEEFVASHPHDSFARYGLALECVNAGDHEAAVEHFRALLASSADYVPGYFHFGQLLARLKRTEEAKNILTDGIAAAQRAGNQHALDEMRAALQELNSSL